MSIFGPNVEKKTVEKKSVLLERAIQKEALGLLKRLTYEPTFS